MLRSALLNVMVQAATKAGRTLKRDFGEVERLQVSLKGPGNFVSAADRRAEEILRHELGRARPGYGFLGEEGGRHEGADKTHTWIVDPLDGTTNFLHGIPQFAIAIALQREDAIVAGRRLQSGARRAVHRRARQGRLPQRSAPARRCAATLGRRRGGVRPAAPRPRRSRAVPPGGNDRAGEGRGAAPVRLGGARSRLDRRRPIRCLLGAQSLAVGHGRRYDPGARGRRLRHRPRRRRRDLRRPATSSRATKRFMASCCEP